jgi:hypothetical protein
MENVNMHNPTAQMVTHGQILQMRDGWSDYHRAKFEREIERLERRIALLKQEISKLNNLPCGHKRCETQQNAAEEKEPLA